MTDTPLPWLLPRSAGRRHPDQLQQRLHTRVNHRVRQLQLEHPTAEVRSARLLLIASNRLIAAGLGWARDAIQAAGVDVEGWSGQQVATACSAPAAGAIALDAWTIQPAALAASLAAQFVAAGGSLHEGTRVRTVTPTREGVSIEHDQGRPVRAGQVVVCAGAYTGSISVPDQPPARVVHTYMRASEPGSGPAAAALGGDELFMAAPGLGMAYWRTHNGRLLFGGKDVGGMPPGDAADALPRAHRALDRLLCRRLPAGIHLPVAHRWGGAMSVTAAEIPHLARSTVSERIVYAVGFGGSGVALTLIAGPLVRDLVLGRATADSEAVALRQAMQATTIPWSGLLGTIPAAAAHLLRGLTPRSRGRRAR